MEQDVLRNVGPIWSLWRLSPGIDGVLLSIFLSQRNTYVSETIIIFSSSITKIIIPNDFKAGKVIPLHKANSFKDKIIYG